MQRVAALLEKHKNAIKFLFTTSSKRLTKKFQKTKKVIAKRKAFFKNYEVNNFYAAIIKDAGWVKSRVSYFLHNWIYTTNHKRIAINYFIFIIFSGITGLVLATVIRLELAYPGVGILAGDSIQYLTIITLHGIIMVFFMIMPLFLGAFGNFLIPTQLGVHDVAFPRMNSASFWFLPGGLIMLCQLLCVDRRYQRVNCFNVREVQSLLKKKYFADLLASHEAHLLQDRTLAGLRYKANQKAALTPSFQLLTNNSLVVGHRSRRWYFENWYRPSFTIPLSSNNDVVRGSTFWQYVNDADKLCLKVLWAIQSNLTPQISISIYRGLINEAKLLFSYPVSFVSTIAYDWKNSTPITFARSLIFLESQPLEYAAGYLAKLRLRAQLEKNSRIDVELENSIARYPLTAWDAIKYGFFGFHFWGPFPVKFWDVSTFFSVWNNFKAICAFVGAYVSNFVRPPFALSDIVQLRDTIFELLRFGYHLAASIQKSVTTIVYLVLVDFKAIDVDLQKRLNYLFMFINEFFLINSWSPSYIIDSFRTSLSIGSLCSKVHTNFLNDNLGLRFIYRFDLLAIALYKSLVVSVQTYRNPSESEVYLFLNILRSTRQTGFFKSGLLSLKVKYNNPRIYLEAFDIVSSARSYSGVAFEDSKFSWTGSLTSKSNGLARAAWAFTFDPFSEFALMRESFYPDMLAHWTTFSHLSAIYGFHKFVTYKVYTFNLYSATPLAVQTLLRALFDVFFAIKSVCTAHFSEKQTLNLLDISTRVFWNAGGAQAFDRNVEAIEDLALRFTKQSKPNFKYDDKAGNFFPEVKQHTFQQMIPSYSNITRGLARPIWYFSEDFIDRFSEFFTEYYSNVVSHFAKKIAFAKTPLLAPDTRYYKLPFWHNNGWDSLFMQASSWLVDGELNSNKWTSIVHLTEKFNRMFLDELFQYRLLGNWRSLKFHREAWRSRALLSRHQRSSYKRYLHEDALFWVVERNSRDVLPGWAFITPFASRTRFTATGKVDMALMAVFLAGAGSIISSANFLLTYRYLSTLGNKKMRDARSFFTEAAMISSGMIIGANPLLLIAILMLLSDRHWRTSFFDYSGGGDTVLFQHMFWFFGHPEVYIIIMPCFGITNTVLTYYLRKRISARASVLYSMYTIAFLSFFVWGHHMYMVGLSHQTRMLYSTVTVMISVPAATKIIHWMVTLVNSSVHFELPLLFTFTFIFFFISGGVSGMGVAHTGMDILFHDTFYVIAHFHVMFASAAMFSGFSAFYFYFPVLFGVKYSRIFAYMHYVYYLIGQLMTVIPMFWLGYAGMPRRILDYPTAFGGWHSIASAGHLISVAGLMAFFFMLADSIRQSKAAIRTTFGVGRYNTRLNFYYYEIYRLNYLRTKSFALLRAHSNSSITWKGKMFRNFEYLETTMFSYALLKK